MKGIRITYPIEAAVFAALILVSTLIFALADAAVLIAGFTVAYLVPRVAYSRLSHSTPLGTLALAGAWMVMSLLGVEYIYTCTSLAGHPFSDPELWHDAARYYQYALDIYNHHYHHTHTMPFPGLPLMTVLTWKIFGINIVYPLAMNLCLTLSTIVLTGSLTVRLLKNRTPHSDKWLSGLAMAITACLFFFISHGTKLLKEPLTYFGFIIVALSLASLKNCHERGMHWRTIATFFLGITLVASTRTTYSIMALMGVVLTALANRKQWRTSLVMIAIGSLMYIFISEVANAISFQHYDTYFDPEKSSLMSYQFIIAPQQMALGSLVGDYFTLVWWRKALLLPLTCIAQYLIPFPWSTASDIYLSEIVPRIRFTWYFVGALVIFYGIFLSWRKSTNLGLYPLWVAFCFVVPAYVTAGSVSRYMLPFQPLMIPLAIYTLSLVNQSKYRKIFCIFACVYVAALIAALIVCYHMQSINML